MIQEFKTRTGAIFCDTEKQLEWLYVGDYGKQANIKADFLGLTKEINGVAHHNVDLAEKMVVTISTQKGCPMRCMFCDCPKVGFHGNASFMEMAMEISEAIETNEAKDNGIETNSGYYNYDVYRQFEQPLLDAGWDVIVFVPSKEEDEDRITCGNALLSNENECNDKR